jgi:hypothetical protein
VIEHASRVTKSQADPEYEQADLLEPVAAAQAPQQSVTGKETTCQMP